MRNSKSENIKLVPGGPEEVSLSPAPEVGYPSYPPTQAFESEGASAVPLSHYLWILQRNLGKMAAFVAVCMVATILVSARLKPIYESTATIDIDMQAPVEIVGQGATSSSNTADPDVFLATQVKLIQSDAVLRPVAEQFHLLNTGGDSGKTELAQKSAAAPVSLPGLTVTRPDEYVPSPYRLPLPGSARGCGRGQCGCEVVPCSYIRDSYSIIGQPVSLHGTATR